jgi:hypothetical protein
VKARLAEKWSEDWSPLELLLDFDKWKPGDAALAEKTRGVLARMEKEAAKRDSVPAVRYLQDQADQAADAASKLGKPDRDRAKRIIAWCDMLAGAVRDIPELKTAADKAGEAKKSAAKIADFKGSFTLRVLVGPFAKVTKATKNGQPFTLRQTDTPFAESELEIADYEFEFTHAPSSKKQAVKVAAATLQDGKTYLISGQMKDPALKVTPQ